MARNTPPSLISYTETTWTAAATSKATASISWQTGDVIGVVCGSENSLGTLGTPTATGLTFTSRVSNQVGSSCASKASTAVAASSSSGAVTVTNSSGTPHWGFGVWVWRGSDGFDVSGEQHTTTKTVSITPTDTHDAVMLGVFDFAGTAAITITPTPTDTRQRVQDGTSYTLYVADYTDVASASAAAYGLSGTSSGPFSIVVLSVFGTTGAAAATSKKLAALGVG